jgi:hypothetical protein
LRRIPRRVSGDTKTMVFLRRSISLVRTRAVSSGAGQRLGVSGAAPPGVNAGVAACEPAASLRRWLQ